MKAYPFDCADAEKRATRNEMLLRAQRAEGVLVRSLDVEREQRRQTLVEHFHVLLVVQIMVEEDNGSRDVEVDNGSAARGRMR